MPPGAVLLYKTNEGRPGKLKVIESGRGRIVVRWVTYNANGSVASAGDRLTVRGTWSADLDLGKECTRDEAALNDFFWQQETATTRYFTFRNGAVFVVFNPKTP